MTSAVVFAIAILLSPRVAGQTVADPFAAFHTSVDHKLQAVLQDAQDPHDTASVTQTAADRAQRFEAASATSNDKRLDIGTFAHRFWGGRSNDLAAAVGRLEAIRPTLESILQSEGVPKDLIGVVLVESGAQPLAQSPRQARGLWQLIPETARRYGLEVGNGRDERIEIEYSTRAAARYLRDLYQRFDDWPLALAAYNAGEDAVKRALERSRATTFPELSAGGLLPAETRTYVPAVLAAMRLFGSETPVKPVAQSGAPWIYALIGVQNRDFPTPGNTQASDRSAAGTAR